MVQEKKSSNKKKNNKVLELGVEATVSIISNLNQQEEENKIALNFDVLLFFEMN